MTNDRQNLYHVSGLSSKWQVGWKEVNRLHDKETREKKEWKKAD
jgi:hypothetical protein